MILWIEIIGFIAAALTTGAGLPQLYKVIKTKQTRDISINFLLVFIIGVFLWMIYGFLILSWPLILANIITFIVWFIILVYKLKYK